MDIRGSFSRILAAALIFALCAADGKVRGQPPRQRRTILFYRRF